LTRVKRRLGYLLKPFLSVKKIKGKGKGKAIPLEAWRGPEGSRKLRPPDFKKFGT
jgi:hypothetical protein